MPVADDHLRFPRIRWPRRATTPGGETVLAAAFLLTLTLAVFGRVLFGPGDVVLSNIDADLAKQFIHWRGFGFQELRAGHLALWNPHIYLGAPFFGGFQSALLYPPNWLYLCLPLARATNFCIALHVFLAGLFMFFWTRHRSLHVLACLLAAVLFMFGGTYFPHIFAGHLSNLCTMVWAPLVFLAIDGWLGRRDSGWLLLGAGVVAIQILAGHPQYVFYTGVAAGAYGLLHLRISQHRAQAIAGLCVMVVGAVGLSAVQVFEGLHAAGESVRSLGTPMRFAAMFSFPPENFITLIVPGFLGDMTGYEYWGRCYLWEMSVFFGISGFVLAIYGGFHGDPPKRRFCAVVAGGLLLLALGGHTPLFRWFYLYAPGFSKFRGWSKFTFPAMLFLIMLAAVGFDRMLRYGIVRSRVATFTLVGGMLLLLGSAMAAATAHWSGAGGPAPWADCMRSLGATGEQLLPLPQLQTTGFLCGAASFAARQMLIAAATTLGLGTVFAVAQKRPRVIGAVLVIALAEMFVFAESWRDTFPLDAALDTPAARFSHGQAAGDDRVLDRDNPNLAMSTGARDVWGYDPGVLLRYAEWMADTQDVDLDVMTQTFDFRNLPPTFATLLRCRNVLTTWTDEHENEQLHVIPVQAPAVAPRLQLMSSIRLMHDRDDIFEAMRDVSFDPERNLILETAPDPPPAPESPSGTAHVVAETSDSLTVEADLPGAAVLLVTDAYCSGWQARSLLPLRQTVQPYYNVLPGDYFLRAIPLAAGHHLLKLEYLPRAFTAGTWTTLISLIVYVGLIIRKTRAWTQRGVAGNVIAAP